MIIDHGEERAICTLRTLLQTDTHNKNKNFSKCSAENWNSDAEQIISSGANLFIEVEQYLCLFSFPRRNSLFLRLNFLSALLL